MLRVLAGMEHCGTAYILRRVRIAGYVDDICWMGRGSVPSCGGFCVGEYWRRRDGRGGLQTNTVSASARSPSLHALHLASSVSHCSATVVVASSLHSDTSLSYPSARVQAGAHKTPGHVEWTSQHPDGHLPYGESLVPEWITTYYCTHT